MSTLNVGTGQDYATLAEAVAASHDGDTIAVQSGTYTNDFATVSTDITIKGVGGMADFVATAAPPNGKGILVTQSDVTIQKLSFSGAKVPDNNGAGIRYERGKLIIEDSYFHDNQNGLLSNADPAGEITIRRSEFEHNGDGDGKTHNLYVGDIASLTIEDSFFHDAVVGHQIKSRARSNIINGSRVYDDTGSGSYSIDLPNGGVGTISGCVIQQGAASQNSVIIHYGGESDAYPGSSLVIDNNTVVNDKTSGSVYLLFNATTITAALSASDVYGLTAAQIASGPVNELGTTFLSLRPTLDSSSPWTDEPPVEPPVKPKPPEGVLAYPTFKALANPEDVARFNLQAKTAQPNVYVSWGQVFPKGKVAADANLGTNIGNRPAQMDVKTRHDDGSVCHAVMTVRAPKFEDVKLKKGLLVTTTAAPGPDVDLEAELADYDVRVELTGEVEGVYDIGPAMVDALADGTASYWLKGPLATQARVEIEVAHPLRLVVDLTAYCDGSFLTDISLRADAAMTPSASKKRYSARIIQDADEVVFSSGPLTHHLYEEWRRVFHSKTGLPTTDTHNVQHHIGDMAKAGAIPNYDMTSGIDSAAIGAIPVSTNIKPFSAEAITKYFPTTGGRDDIGLMPAWHARWVKCQDIDAARFALANANAAGSVPWHYWDKDTKDYLWLDKHPTMWVDYRGTPKLTQDTEDTTWGLDTAHTPALSFIPYLLTGERYHLDQVMSQANVILMNWDYPRGNEKGLAFDNSFQVRGQAWMFRSMSEAAWIIPDADEYATPKAFWKKIVNNNLDQLLKVWIPKYNNQWKEVAGFVMGELPTSGKYQIAPWQEDFVTIAIAAAAGRGDAKAMEVLKWIANWSVGRFTHRAQGNGWALAVDYYSNVGGGKGNFYDTWEKLGADNNQGDVLPTNGANYVPLAMQSLAAIYNLLGDPAALASYKAVMAQGVPGTRVGDYRTTYPHFHVVPRLDQRALTDVAGERVAELLRAAEGAFEFSLVVWPSGHDGKPTAYVSTTSKER